MTDVPRHISGGLSGDAGSARSTPIDPVRHTLWWLATWLAASIAGSTVLLSLFRVAPGDGVPLATPLGIVGASLVVLWAVQMAGMLLASRRLGSGDPVVDYGLRVEPVDVAGVPVGVATQLLLVPLVYLPLRAVDGDTFSDERLEDTASDLVGQAQGGLLVLLVFLVVVGAPVVEEVFYRGMLQRPLLGRFGPFVAVPIVAVVFASIHFRPVEFAGLAVAGLVFGACAARTGRIGMAVAAHVGFNATGVIAVL